MRSHWFTSITLAAALLAGAQVCAAKDWGVNVGGSQTSGDPYCGTYSSPVLQFSPSNLTITAGDTVTFNNLGGAPHNVHADDNSFRCANGCDDTGGSGAISESNWTFTRTFSTAGVVSYHCDQHVSMGMTGSITVNAAVATGMPISATTSGSWYNPQQFRTRVSAASGPAGHDRRLLVPVHARRFGAIVGARRWQFRSKQQHRHPRSGARHGSEIPAEFHVERHYANRLGFAHIHIHRLLERHGELDVEVACVR